MQYADFWKRTAAYLVDYVIYEIICIFLSILVMMGLRLGGQDVSELTFNLGLVLMACIVYLLYYVGPECSACQATLGKRMFHLKVTDTNGQRIGFWRSLGRNVGMFVSSIILCIGYLMCLWTERKQCLHDQMAGCLVIDETPQEKQGCAIAVVVTFLIGCFMLPFIIGIVIAIALPSFTYSRAAERVSAAEALTLLHKVRTQQQLFLADNQRYATQWQEFNMPIVSDETFCLTPDQTCTPEHKFQVLLERRGVTALRINTQQPYQLTLAYAPGEKVVCTAENTQCQQLGL